jgi:hypothetical protein
MRKMIQRKVRPLKISRCNRNGIILGPTRYCRDYRLRKIGSAGISLSSQGIVMRILVLLALNYYQNIINKWIESLA